MQLFEQHHCKGICFLIDYVPLQKQKILRRTCVWLIAPVSDSLSFCSRRHQETPVMRSTPVVPVNCCVCMIPDALGRAVTSGTMSRLSHHHQQQAARTRRRRRGFVFGVRRKSVSVLECTGAESRPANRSVIVATEKTEACDLFIFL